MIRVSLAAIAFPLVVTQLLLASQSVTNSLSLPVVVSKTPRALGSSRPYTTELPIIFRANDAENRSSSSSRHEQHLFLQTAFESIVDSSEFLELQQEQCNDETDDTAGGVRSGEIHSSCRIPLLGPDIVVRFYLLLRNTTTTTTKGSSSSNSSSSFILHVDGASATLNDFGWICSKFYAERNVFDQQLNTDTLRQQVRRHWNRQPPDPGVAANSLAVQQQQQLGSNTTAVLTQVHVQHLERNGYVVVDTSLHISDQSHDDMTELLIETTGDAYRKDVVHFLSRPEAVRIGLREPFDSLMSIAVYLNKYLTLRASRHAPLAPATLDDPLTLPLSIQLAQYGEGGYYVAHSDNSLDTGDHDDHDNNSNSNDNDDINKKDDLLRSNFRQFTCIHYCTDMETADGGALRLYLHSRDYRSPQDAVRECQHVVDVVPQNGRLVIFDSCMVHAVQTVTTAKILRRALTLWIQRPNDSGVRGEQYY